MTKSIFETLIELSEAPSATDVRDTAGLTALGAQGTKMAANAAKAAKAAKFASKVVPFAGSAVNAADAVNRAQQGDNWGAAIAGVGAIPILSIPAMGIQAIRDKMKTGSFMPDNDEIKAASTSNVLLAKFDDDTSHTYTNVKKLPTDAEINARIKQDFPNKKVSNIVKGKF
jgi:hypothetical protein